MTKDQKDAIERDKEFWRNYADHSAKELLRSNGALTAKLAELQRELAARDERIRELEQRVFEREKYLLASEQQLKAAQERLGEAETLLGRWLEAWLGDVGDEECVDLVEIDTKEYFAKHSKERGNG